LTLISLLSPLRAADTVDFRPYITLYEGDVKDYSARGKGPGGLGNVMLGISNPYIA
jgi:hypothetical protein